MEMAVSRQLYESRCKAERRTKCKYNENKKNIKWRNGRNRT